MVGARHEASHNVYIAMHNAERHRPYKRHKLNHSQRATK